MNHSNITATALTSLPFLLIAFQLLLLSSQIKLHTAGQTKKTREHYEFVSVRKGLKLIK
ncbi:MAG: hypothetical protein ABI045_02615 [Flavobacteriales bacterium]